MMGWGSGFGWGGMLIGGIMMLLFWGAIAAVVVLAFWAAMRGRGTGSSGHTDSALDIVRQRYARGEITKEQYEAMRRDLLQ